MKDIIRTIKINELYPFKDTPFRPHDLGEITESIKENGILSPLIARPGGDGGYEVISGYRRMLGAEKAGIKDVPVIVREMDDDTAIITLVDSNLHRENILASERAFAYKMKLEAIKHQGLTCVQLGHKSRDVIAEGAGVSSSQVQRYIRLTELIKPLLDLVDSGRIAISPAVELSYLLKERQHEVVLVFEAEDKTPSYSQAVRMRKMSSEGILDKYMITKIMSEDKPNQREVLKLKSEKIQGFFPPSYTSKQMEDVILKLLEGWHRQQNRERERSR